MVSRSQGQSVTANWVERESLQVPTLDGSSGPGSGELERFNIPIKKRKFKLMAAMKAACTQHTVPVPATAKKGSIRDGKEANDSLEDVAAHVPLKADEHNLDIGKAETVIEERNKADILEPTWIPRKQKRSKMLRVGRIVKPTSKDDLVQSRSVIDSEVSDEQVHDKVPDATRSLLASSVEVGTVFEFPVLPSIESSAMPCVSAVSDYSQVNGVENKTCEPEEEGVPLTKLRQTTAQETENIAVAMDLDLNKTSYLEETEELPVSQPAEITCREAEQTSRVMDLDLNKSGGVEEDSHVTVPSKGEPEANNVPELTAIESSSSPVEAVIATVSKDEACESEGKETELKMMKSSVSPPEIAKEIEVKNEDDYDDERVDYEEYDASLMEPFVADVKGPECPTETEDKPALVVDLKESGTDPEVHVENGLHSSELGTGMSLPPKGEADGPERVDDDIKETVTKVKQELNLGSNSDAQQPESRSGWDQLPEGFESAEEAIVAMREGRLRTRDMDKSSGARSPLRGWDVCDKAGSGHGRGWDHKGDIIGELRGEMSGTRRVHEKFQNSFDLRTTLAPRERMFDDPRHLHQPWREGRPVTPPRSRFVEDFNLTRTLRAAASIKLDRDGFLLAPDGTLRRATSVEITRLKPGFPVVDMYGTVPRGGGGRGSAYGRASLMAYGSRTHMSLPVVGGLSTSYRMEEYRVRGDPFSVRYGRGAGFVDGGRQYPVPSRCDLYEERSWRGREHDHAYSRFERSPLPESQLSPPSRRSRSMTRKSRSRSRSPVVVRRDGSEPGRHRSSSPCDAKGDARSKARVSSRTRATGESGEAIPDPNSQSPIHTDKGKNADGIVTVEEGIVKVDGQENREESSRLEHRNGSKDIGMSRVLHQNGRCIPARDDIAAELGRGGLFRFAPNVVHGSTLTDKRDLELLKSIRGSGNDVSSVALTSPKRDRSSSRELSKPK